MNIYILYYIIHILLYRFSYSLSREYVFPSFSFTKLRLKLSHLYKVKKKKKKNKADDEQRVNIHSRALVHEKWRVHFAISIAKYSQLPDGIASKGSGMLSGWSRFILLFCDLDEKGKKASAC